MKPQVAIFGAPFDGGGARLGSRLGPTAIELAGLEQTLSEVGIDVCGWSTIGSSHRTQLSGLRNFSEAYDTISKLSERTLGSLRNGEMPLILGGEHSISIGSIAGALRFTEGNLAILWIDAHADVNVPGGSLSGNIHGMPLGALAGLPSLKEEAGSTQWSQFLSLIGDHKLQLENIAWFGLRDVDEAEQETIRTHPAGLPISMFEIDRDGIGFTLARFKAWLFRTGCQNLWISFDVDALDPALAPGTGTAVRGGLTYREAHVIAEYLRWMFDEEGCPVKLLGLDVVEVNPLEDTCNSTAKMAVEWLGSLFGKTILGVKP